VKYRPASPPQKTAEQIDRETVAEYQNQSIGEDACLGSDLVVCSDCERPIPSYLFIDYKYSGKMGVCPLCGGILRFNDRQSIESSKDEVNTSVQSELREDIIILAIILCVSIAIASAIAISGEMTGAGAVGIAILLFVCNVILYFAIKSGASGYE